MKTVRGGWVRKAMAALALVTGASLATAQDRGVTSLVVAFPAGGPADFIARVLADKQGAALGDRVIVENRPGGNGAIAAGAVMREAADGRTLWLTSVGAVAINPHLYRSLPYDPRKDFVPVSTVVNSPEVFVVNAASPFRTVQEFVAAARAKQGALNMASSGTGSVPHLALALLNEAANVDIPHVPYRGAAPAIVDLIGGHVDGFIGDVPALNAHIQSGKLRAIGASSVRRLALYPDLPTLQEQGLPNVHSDNWYALFARAGTPQPVLDRINAAVRSVLADPAVVATYQEAGLEVLGGPPAALEALLQTDTDRWGTVVRRAGIKAD